VMKTVCPECECFEKLCGTCGLCEDCCECDDKEEEEDYDELGGEG
jgi:hypothetical protein